MTTPEEAPVTHDPNEPDEPAMPTHPDLDGTALADALAEDVRQRQETQS